MFPLCQVRVSIFSYEKVSINLGRKDNESSIVSSRHLALSVVIIRWKLAKPIGSQRPGGPGTENLERNLFL